MNLSDRIKEAADEVGGLNQLAVRTGIARRTIGSWLEGRKPKPEALQKIAEVADINVAWLITGVGEKYSAERLVREAEQDRQKAELNRDLGNALRANDQRRLTRDPFFAMEVERRGPRFDIAVLEKIARIVTRAYKDAHIQIAPEKISVEAGELYNELMARVINYADPLEIEATLPQIEHLLRKRLSEAKDNPGTGKRSA
ncbi:helix-turn-helix domain-containing protein [Brucella haematophila]|uniref:Helix-turn-helix transcriptional regulator n=1 Tax=Brucella haematophila TaxID=419474 RepID=A0ABX1DJF5_9HYPH|nr:helix-turn-helix transcriptional regulator [Brucella haematophila]NKC02558.1 helix-turn-helix transcriptional regulator [Brucella haematophila]